MPYLLDTNTCIDALKRRPPAVEARLRSLQPTDIAVSIITAAELWLGVHKSRDPAREGQIINTFLSQFRILPFDIDAGRCYARIRADLESRGQKIGPMDTLIAAHGLSLGLIVVTHNLREFKRVPGLGVESWR